jgi:hypothetical protein
MQKSKNLATRTPNKKHRELMRFKWVKISCSTKGPYRVVLFKNLVVSDARGKEI